MQNRSARILPLGGGSCLRRTKQSAGSRTKRKGAIFLASFKERRTSTLRPHFFLENTYLLESDEFAYAPIEELILNQLLRHACNSLRKNGMFLTPCLVVSCFSVRYRALISCSPAVFSTGEHTHPVALHRLQQQTLHSSQVQCRRGQLKHPFHPASSTKLGLPHSRHVFDPAKYLLHSFSFLLTLRKSRIFPLPGPQPVRLMSAGHRVLGYVGHHLPRP